MNLTPVIVLGKIKKETNYSSIKKLIMTYRKENIVPIILNLSFQINWKQQIVTKLEMDSKEKNVTMIELVDIISWVSDSDKPVKAILENDLEENNEFELDKKMRLSDEDGEMIEEYSLDNQILQVKKYKKEKIDYREQVDLLGNVQNKTYFKNGEVNRIMLYHEGKKVQTIYINEDKKITGCLNVSSDIKFLIFKKKENITCSSLTELHQIALAKLKDEVKGSYFIFQNETFKNVRIKLTDSLIIEI